MHYSCQEKNGKQPGLFPLLNEDALCLVDYLLTSTDDLSTGSPGFLANPFRSLPGPNGDPLTPTPNLARNPLSAGVTAPNQSFIAPARPNRLSSCRERIVIRDGSADKDY